jgi:hypothetical protein
MSWDESLKHVVQQFQNFIRIRALMFGTVDAFGG